MRMQKRRRGATKSTAAAVRQRIERDGERLWHLSDFDDLPFLAVAQALSRLVRRGVLQRLSKGTYYRSRDTSLGRSRPNPAAVRALAAKSASVFPSGLEAAGLLGLTTQTSARGEVATSAGSLPRKLVGAEVVVHARRPASWKNLTQHDAALLDVLRRLNRLSELSPEETTRRLLDLLRAKGRFERLTAVADTEPPRVRAMLGALGEELGKKPGALLRLRRSLNPLSKFDFGPLSVVRTASDWQAKEPRR